MVRATKKKKKDDDDASSVTNPETTERTRLKKLAFSNRIISDTPSDQRLDRSLAPSKTVLKHHGKDILKKSNRKNRFLFSFPGLLAPAAGGKIGELKDLGSKNPILYLDFPQGRMKLFGTIVYPQNRYLTLQFSRGGKNVMCEDYFDNMVVFSDAWWIGSKDDNPEEARLDLPEELIQEPTVDYDFKGGAGGAFIDKQGLSETPIKSTEQPFKAELEDDTSDSEPDLKDLNQTTPVQQSARTAGKRIRGYNIEDDTSDSEPDLTDLNQTTPVRQSARTAGKRISFAESSSGGDSVGSAADIHDIEEEEEKEEKADLDHKSATITAGKSNYSDYDIDDEGVHADSQVISVLEKKLKSNAKSSSHQSSLVQSTISTLFKKVEEKKVTKTPRKTPLSKVPAEKSRQTSAKRKIDQTEGSRKKNKVIAEKRIGKGEKKDTETEDDDIEEFSSQSKGASESDEDWVA